MGELGALGIGPALVLSVLVGMFHTFLYVVIRAQLGVHLLVVAPAAIVGAYVGQALGVRLGDPIQVGDFSVLWASALSWIGIAIAALTSTLRPSRSRS